MKMMTKPSLPSAIKRLITGLKHLQPIGLRVCTLGLLVVTVSACSTNPVTGKRQLSFMSPQQEVALGEKNYKPYQQQQGGQYQVDPGVTRYVQRVGQKLAAVSDRKDLPYEFAVLNNDVPNAWALPGGKIAINRGLLVLLESEAELAAVLGHEIVHAAAKHGAQQQTQGTLLGIGAFALGAATQQSAYRDLIATGTQIGAGAWQARYSRSHELEADAYGIEYMVAAGYDPEGAVDLQEKFLALKGGQKSNMLDSWFATHPPSEERVARNKELAAQYGRVGKMGESDYRKQMAQLIKDQPAYDSNTQALAAAKEGNMDLAESLVSKAIRMQPKEGLFYITQGQLALSNKNTAAAQKSFSKAVSLNPNYFQGHLFRGVAAYQSKDFNTAENALEKSLGILPTQPGAFYLGEIKNQKGDKQTALQLYNFAAQSGGELGQVAQQRAAALGGTTQATAN